MLRLMGISCDEYSEAMEDALARDILSLGCFWHPSSWLLNKLFVCVTVCFISIGMTLHCASDGDIIRLVM